MIIPNIIYKQAIIIPTYLGMSVGKVASQACHAAVAGASRHLTVDKRVILRVDTVDEFTALLAEAYQSDVSVRVIIDEGLTEVPPGSATALSIWGTSVVVSKITDKLKLL